MTEMRIKKAFRLLADFFVIGFFTFGGGWSIITQIQKKYVEDSDILSNEELLDIASVARSLPGIMVLNVAMILGHKVAGYLGGVACLIGIAIPPFMVILVVTTLYDLLGRSSFLLSAMVGVRIAIVPIIAYSAISMVKRSIRDLPCLFILILAFVCNYTFGFSYLAIVVIGSICGLLISAFYGRRDSN